MILYPNLYIYTFIHLYIYTFIHLYIYTNVAAPDVDVEAAIGL